MLLVLPFGFLTPSSHQTENRNHHIQINRVDTIITKEEDKHKELKHVKEALRDCGHPEWSLHRRPRGKGDTERRESQSFRKHNIRTAQESIQKLAIVLFTKKKGKIHDLNIYYHKCKVCDEDYIGETGRFWWERMHEHRLMSHKEAKTAHTFNHQTEEQTHNLPMIGEVRRSKRISQQEKTNYFELTRGGTLHTWRKHSCSSTCHESPRQRQLQVKDHSNREFVVQWPCPWTVNGRYLSGANWNFLVTLRTVLLRCYFLI